ncbi:DUF4870 domain-containing protein [Demequina litorisediminis]|uniref:DUF4870 domain-containing protein n=1 Tax=Demequina litorisediminis TaxID=1849022 RepID=A0ABQ6IA53_9MICO|nr:DUF4870 domain-containing protein [Demequina litorisediminis]GMA34215.1 hypothetical protein GCM10025876_04190 [Demequina litorisediminis]
MASSRLNLQITGLIVAAGALVITLMTFGFGGIVALPAWIAYWVYSIVISFVAAAKANSGEYYPIRFAIPFIK